MRRLAKTTREFAVAHCPKTWAWFVTMQQYVNGVRSKRNKNQRPEDEPPLSSEKSPVQWKRSRSSKGFARTKGFFALFVELVSATIVFGGMQALSGEVSPTTGSLATV